MDYFLPLSFSILSFCMFQRQTHIIAEGRNSSFYYIKLENKPCNGWNWKFYFALIWVFWWFMGSKPVICCNRLYGWATSNNMQIFFLFVWVDVINIYINMNFLKTVNFQPKIHFHFLTGFLILTPLKKNCQKPIINHFIAFWRTLI